MTLELPMGTEGTRLDRCLTVRGGLEVSRSKIRTLIAAGRVRLSGGGTAGGPLRPSAVLPGPLTLEIDLPEPPPAESVAEALPLSILYEDADVVVVDKPAGMVVHPAAGHAAGTLVNALLHRYPGIRGVGGLERPGIVHRLDRGTSGAIVVARTDESFGRLRRMVAAREVSRVYLALVSGRPARAEGRIEAAIGRNPRDRRRMAVLRSGRPAATRYRVLASSKRASLIEATLETGRTHQIRVHLSHIGCPVLGDPDYGRRPPVPAWLRALALARPMLHAWRLSFSHPRTGRPVSVVVPPPPDFLRAQAGTVPDS